MAVYLFLIHRVTSRRNEIEVIIIIQRERKNSLPIDIIYRLNITIKHETTQPSTNYTHSPKPCVSFTCHSPLVRKVTNPFKNTDLIITFPTINTIYNLLRIQCDKKDKYLHSGIYNIKSLTFNKIYDGQTGRNLCLRFLENLQYIRNNNPHSAHATFMPNHEHKFETKQDIVDLTMIARRGTDINC